MTYLSLNKKSPIKKYLEKDSSKSDQYCHYQGVPDSGEHSVCYFFGDTLSLCDDVLSFGRTTSNPNFDDSCDICSKMSRRQKLLLV